GEGLASGPGLGGKPSEDPRHQLPFVQEVQRHFGAALSAIYQLGLAETLVDEAAWYISTLAWHGLSPAGIRRMIEAWSIAIYSTIKPPEADELVAPIRWIRLNLERLSERTREAGTGEAEGIGGTFPTTGPASTPEPPGTPRTRKPRPGQSPELTALMGLVLDKRRREATDYVLNLARNGRSVGTLQAHLFAPTLREIGLLWQRGEITAADEHAATEICRYVLFRLLDDLPREARLPHTALVAAVTGEEHAFGAEILAGYLDLKGWNTVFLGRSAPAEDIVEAARSTGCQAVFLSVGLIANLPAAISLAQALRRLPIHPKVIIGGRAAEAAGEALARYCDAVIEDLEDAHIQALRMLGSHA
ncbi:MAG: cobalamin B12-binding domain-containing protein, partial [bacterium]